MKWNHRITMLLLAVLVGLLMLPGPLNTTAKGNEVSTTNSCTVLSDLGQTLRKYNVISLTELGLAQSDFAGPAAINGNAFVGTNLISNHSMTLGPATFSPYLDPTIPTLSVVGNTGSGNAITVRGGSFYLGGELNRSVNFVGNGQIVPDSWYSDIGATKLKVGVGVATGVDWSPVVIHGRYIG